MIKSKISRYNQTYRSEIDGEEFIFEDNFMLWPDSGDERYVVGVAEENRLDLLSYRVYRNPLLAWIIARRNNIVDVNNVPAGTILYCPTISRIYEDGGVLAP